VTGRALIGGTYLGKDAARHPPEEDTNIPANSDVPQAETLAGK
jgi:hypothetical protein